MSLVSSVGVLAALILLSVSAAMNWQFGYSLGKTEFDSHILGAASIAADGMKALMPFFIFSAWRQRNYPQAMGAAALWAVCILYAMTSALGFAALNRSDTSGQRAMQHEKYEDLRAEMTRINQQQGWLEKHRPTGTVQADIEGAKQNTRWTTSAGCTNATVDKSREFCENFHKLGAELAIAKQADALARQYDEIRAKLAGVTSGQVAKVADPQAQILSSIFGLDISRIDVAMTLLITALVELGSSLGLYVSTSIWRIGEIARRPTPEPVKVVEIIRPNAPMPVAMPAAPEPVQLAAPKTDIQQYFDDRIKQDDGSSVTALALYDNYCEWCETHRARPRGPADLLPPAHGSGRAEGQDRRQDPLYRHPHGRRGRGRRQRGHRRRFVGITTTILSKGWPSRQPLCLQGREIRYSLRPGREGDRALCIGTGLPATLDRNPRASGYPAEHDIAGTGSPLAAGISITRFGEWQRSCCGRRNTELRSRPLVQIGAHRQSR